MRQSLGIVALSASAALVEARRFPREYRSEPDATNHLRRGLQHPVVISSSYTTVLEDRLKGVDSRPIPTNVHDVTTTITTAQDDSCETISFKYNFDDVVLTQVPVGENLQVPLLDPYTQQVVGRYNDAATYFDAVQPDCLYYGAYSLFPQKYTNSTQFTSLISSIGTCMGTQDAVVGGVGIYKCASGYASFNDSVSTEFGIVNLYICNTGC
jgi:hypothetical protein